MNQCPMENLNRYLWPVPYRGGLPPPAATWEKGVAHRATSASASLRPKPTGDGPPLRSVRSRSFSWETEFGS
jgi:hypothetical protein